MSQLDAISLRLDGHAESLGYLSRAEELSAKRQKDLHARVSALEVAAGYGDRVFITSKPYSQATAEQFAANLESAPADQGHAQRWDSRRLHSAERIERLLSDGVVTDAYMRAELASIAADLRGDA